MKRDTLKTLAGLVIIGVIVVATFMYGNAQRQAQIKHDQAVKKQQEAQAAKSALPSATAKPSSTGAVAAASGKPQANTAPVQSPKSNGIQGNGSTQTPKPTGQVAAASATPKPTSTPLPTTGSPIDGAVGVMALVGSVVALRWSKKSLLAAARTPR